MAECLRVARRTVLVAAPYGLPREGTSRCTVKCWPPALRPRPINCGSYKWECRNLERSFNLHRSLCPLRKLSAGYDLLTLSAPGPSPSSPRPPPVLPRFCLLAQKQ